MVPATSATAECMFLVLASAVNILASYDGPAETEQLADTALPPGQRLQAQPEGHFPEICDQRSNFF